MQKETIKERIAIYLTGLHTTQKRILVHPKDYLKAVSRCGRVYRGLPIETFKRVETSSLRPPR